MLNRAIILFGITQGQPFFLWVKKALRLLWLICNHHHPYRQLPWFLQSFSSSWNLWIKVVTQPSLMKVPIGVIIQSKSTYYMILSRINMHTHAQRVHGNTIIYNVCKKDCKIVGIVYISGGQLNLFSFLLSSTSFCFYGFMDQLAIWM